MKTDWIILIVAAFIGVLVFMGSFVIISPGYAGVYIVLGKMAPEPRTEGWNWKLPFISSIKKISLKQQTVSGETQCFSKDVQTLDVQYSVLYRIPLAKIPTLYQQYAGDPYESLIAPRLSQVLKETVSSYSAEDSVKNREEVRKKTLALLGDNMGGLLFIADFTINDIGLSDELEWSIEAKMVEEQKTLAKKYEKQQAVIQAEIIVVQATAEAESVRIRGEALKQSPEVVSLEIVKKWNGISPTTVVVGTGGANVVYPLK